MDEKFYLYKYFNLEGKVKTNAGSISRFSIVRDLLLNKRIFIPSLKVLNDPFEEMVNNEKELKSTEKDLMTGVLSFTTHYDNLLMWSHYGSSHTGIVVKFSIDKSEEQYFKKVQYVQGKSELNLHERILVKSYHWSYENEYRRAFKKSSHHINLQKIGLSIEGVIAGSKCSKKHHEQIGEICLVEGVRFGSVKLNRDFSCSLKDSVFVSPLKRCKNSIIHETETAGYEDIPEEEYDIEHELAQIQAQGEYYADLEYQAEKHPEYKKLLKKQKGLIKKLSKYKVDN